MKKERGSASKGRQGRASGKPMRGSERALLPVLELIRASARTVDGLVAELGMAGLRAALELSEAGRLPGAGRGSGRKGPGRDGSSEAERLRRQILETAGVEAAATACNDSGTSTLFGLNHSPLPAPLIAPLPSQGQQKQITKAGRRLSTGRLSSDSDPPACLRHCGLPNTDIGPSYSSAGETSAAVTATC